MLQKDFLPKRGGFRMRLTGPRGRNGSCMKAFEPPEWVLPLSFWGAVRPIFDRLSRRRQKWKDKQDPRLRTRGALRGLLWVYAMQDIHSMQSMPASTFCGTLRTRHPCGLLVLFLDVT
jgi:hypothetical protein